MLISTIKEKQYRRTFRKSSKMIVIWNIREISSIFSHFRIRRSKFDMKLI